MTTLIAAPLRLPRPRLAPEYLLLLACLGIAAFGNPSFWQSALAGREAAEPRTWLFALALFAIVASLHFLLLGLLTPRRLLKPVLGLAVCATAAAAWYMQAYTVYFDTAMLRNILHTEPKEAVELLTPGAVATVLAWSSAPLALLAWVRVDAARDWRRAALQRLLALLAAAALAVLAAGAVFQDLAALMRNDHQLRFLVTPANLMVSGLRVLASDARGAATTVRRAIDPDARMETADGRRPRLLVLALGETVRAQNWGLNGYERQTTPRLAQVGVLNFPEVSACGTSTEVSVPCVFSRLGRHEYRESRAREEESLLHLLERVGVKTLWLDNQTGSKRVASGLEEVRIRGDADPALCDGSLCLDEVMLGALRQRLDGLSGDALVVLHALGNHGPAYYRRYPAAFRRWTPTCDTSQLGDCSVEQIRNAYDNAILYTDHWLAEAHALLQAVETHEVAWVYVSDHGESLGEHGLYLHGIPYAIAPAEQTRVPMVAWLSEALQRSDGIGADCLQAQAGMAASHDSIFHLALGVFRVRTALYRSELDPFAACRGSAQPGDMASSAAPRALPKEYEP
jgi:lipid A ethanolaminephosphotransferase